MVLLEKKSLCILIDSGSTHNFINANIVGKLGCVMEYINELRVLTANGNVLKCKERCRRFPWVMQGQNFVADVLSLPLDNYDLVLGVQWLVELGDIVWNFNKLQMRFKVGEEDHMLQGEKMTRNSLLNVSEEKMGKVLSKSSQVAMIHFFNLQVTSIIQDGDAKEKVNIIPFPLQRILLKYADIFAEPVGLPPCRNQDHQIVLKE